MKVYKYENATVYVHGEVNKERLKKATIRLVKDARLLAKERDSKHVYR